MDEIERKIPVCILHIGTEKTGTSTIQRFLVNNKKVLRENGVGLSLVAGWANNRRIAAYFQPRMDDGYFLDNKILTAEDREAHFSDFEERFFAEIQSLPKAVQKVVITTEFFHSRLTTRESVEGLRNMLSKCFERFHIVCYFREQSRLARSLYSTSIKGGNSNDFERFTKWIKPGVHYYDCAVIADLWSDVFAGHVFQARLYERESLLGQDVVTDFMATALPEVPMDDLAMPDERQNEGLGSIGIAIGRAINTVYPRYEPNGDLSKTRKDLMAMVERSNFCKRGDIPFPEAEKIYSDFEASNKDFAKRYLKTEANPFRPPTYGSTGPQVELNPEELSAFLVDFLKTLEITSKLPAIVPDTTKTKSAT